MTTSPPEALPRPSAAASPWAQVRALLPQGLALPRSTWEARHAFVVWVLAGHVAALPVLGFAGGWSAAASLGEPLLVAALAAMAASDRLGERTRSALAALDLALCSAIVVQFAGGVTEAHFHVFIAIALIALYQDWLALLLGVGLAVGTHVAGAALAPEWAYHGGAAAEPWKWTLVHALAFVAEAGALLAFWAGAEQARARNALVLDAAAEGVIGLDASGQILMANPAAGTLLGRSEEGLIGRDIRSFLGGVAESLGLGTRVPLRGTLHALDGRELAVEWTLTPMARTSFGIGAVLVVRDITVRHALEVQLHERTAQQETVARLGRAGLESRELATVLDVAAREVAATLGVDFATIEQLAPDQGTLVLRAGVGWRHGVGRAPLRVEEPYQPGFTLRSLHPVVVEDYELETRFSAPPGLRGTVLTSGLSVVVPGQDGAWGVLAVYSRHRRAFGEDDVTFVQSVANLLATVIERQAIEDELRAHRLDLEAMVSRRTAQLTEANRELEAFSYTVSHDLRAPLRSIDGFSRLLLQKHSKDLPAEARQMLRLLGDGAVRMGALLESVLSLSRLSRVQLARQPVDLSGMAEEILRDLAAKAPERRGRVEWTVQPGLVADADPGLLRLALQNLLSNAWKFTGKVRNARIAVRGVLSDPADPAAGLAFVVEDNGAGFDPQYAQQLFQPFHRLHLQSEFEGSGIGLATVKRIVARHGGRIWAESRLGEGARFWFTLAGEPPSVLGPPSAPSVVPWSPTITDKDPVTAIPDGTAAPVPTDPMLVESGR